MPGEIDMTVPEMRGIQMKKHIAPTLVVLIASFCCTGCMGPRTPADVRAKPYKTHEFTVESEYRSVYKKLLSKAKQTQRSHFLGGTHDVEGDVYEENETCTISMYMIAWYGVNYTAVIDVKKTKETKSQVILYTALGANPWLTGAKIEQWSGIYR